MESDIVLLTNFTPLQPNDLIEGRDAGRDWTSVKAVKDRRVYKMPLGLYRSFTPTADTPLTLLWLAKTIYPERFADIDLQPKPSIFTAMFSVCRSQRRKSKPSMHHRPEPRSV